MRFVKVFLFLMLPCCSIFAQEIDEERARKEAIVKAAQEKLDRERAEFEAENQKREAEKAAKDSLEKKIQEIKEKFNVLRVKYAGDAQLIAEIDSKEKLAIKAAKEASKKELAQKKQKISGLQSTKVDRESFNAELAELFDESKVKVNNDKKGYNRISFGYSSQKLICETTGNPWMFDFDNKKNMKMKGAEASYLRGISVSKKIPLFVEIGGQMQFNIYKETESYTYEGQRYEDVCKFTNLSLSIPINITYKHTFANGFYIAPYFGANVRANLTGKIDYDGSDSSDYYNIFKADDDDEHAYFYSDENPCKRFQYGCQFGVNFGYKALNIGIGYHVESPLYKDSFEDEDFDRIIDTKYKMRNISIALGINF